MAQQTTTSDSTYKVSTVSQQLDLTPAGLRKWCETYGDFLSDAATPRRGATRRFTAADVRTLEAIAKMRSADLSHDQIKLRLADAAQDAEPGQPAPLPETPETPAPLATVPDQVRTADLVKFENVMELQSQNAELSRRVDRLTYLIYGAVVLLVLTLVAVLAIVALAN